MHLRRRAPGTHLVNAYAGPDDRKVAATLAEIDPAGEASLNDAVRSVRRERRGVMLVYPITHEVNPGKAWHPTMGFTLVFPRNGIKRQIGFVVRNPDQPYEPIIPA